jgi:hypothetical protein
MVTSLPQTLYLTPWQSAVSAATSLHGGHRYLLQTFHPIPSLLQSKASAYVTSHVCYKLFTSLPWKASVSSPYCLSRLSNHYRVSTSSKQTLRGCARYGLWELYYQKLQWPGAKNIQITIALNVLDNINEKKPVMLA